MRCADHNRARLEAQCLISFIDMNTLPIDPFFIIGQLDFIIEPYSKHEKDFPYAIAILRKKKCEAITTQNPETGTFHIRYDDGPHIPKDRMRFTIAHEIGHACLDHPKEFGMDCARRGGIVNKNHPAEKEADTFAGELLRPPILLALTGVSSYYDIQQICDVSFQAANVGERQVKTVQKFMYKTCKEEIEFYQNQFYDFIHQKYCPECNNYFIFEHAKFCSICGNQNILWGNIKSPVYDFVKDVEFMIYDNARILKCPICENEEFNPGEPFCKICGSFLINSCGGRFEVDPFGNRNYTTAPCNIQLPANARFCPKCGAPSMYNNWNLFEDWNLERERKQNQDSFPAEKIPF
ncbi:ImmA/IrrE family metallo-endopeptidase [Sporomusa acidovorans]|uniref:IrrE N-terminal-like domain-containing protein n=1 Tax=Sporomusa acidovorans (strain ATCC 49682 / DSM 3132 / Mol) TaxID=1123286 RepID=A0ABZ3J8K5_SPOA4|nr:ImmA/IrrE family metallo-endopeptidase [Sporomusa acidovorans]OZC16053.1 double zinc ribbon [Sporomusa acidovorans DSM 3132]SDD88220.1 protein of unknown function [Sporomusa acidovorans]